MATERVYGLVFEIDVSRSVESLFECICSHERCCSVVFILFKNRFRDVDPLVGDVEFLSSTLSCEDVAKVVGRKRLMRSRV